MTNEQVANAMRAHHASMVEEVRQRTEELWRTATDWGHARHALARYLQDEILPHARAEEGTVYARGQQIPALAGLVRSMRYEHEVIGHLTHRLEQAFDWHAAADVASRVAELFAVHAGKEDRFIIAELEASPDANLEDILGGLREELAGETHPPA